MKRKQQRMRIILTVLAGFGVAAGLSLYALRDNVSLFRSPADVAILRLENSPAVAPGRVFRLGGLVVNGSLQKNPADDMAIIFAVTDTRNEIMVFYRGIVPDLFREGQGVVAKGALDTEGNFLATELLAKHDENYMPPEVKRALEKAHEAGIKGTEP